MAAAHGGPMTFAAFMDLALYHPEGGYYTRPEMKVGKGGDFYTSPTIQPAFGTCLARQLSQCWELMGRPSELQLLELGAGSGQLASQVLIELARHRGRWKTLRYSILERSPSLRKSQAEALKDFGPMVQWVNDLSELAPDGLWQGVVFSNELFDALPTHRVMGLSAEQAGSEAFPILEIGVELREGSWRQVLMPTTTPRLAQTLAAEGIMLRESQQAEVCLAAQDLMERLGGWLGKGFVLSIDYGGPAEKVYAPHRKKGTLRSYYRQLLVGDPLARPGEQDLTIDVDFTALVAAGNRAGLRTLGVVPQGDLLRGLGIIELEHEAVKGIKSELEASQVAFDFRKLYEPEGMGDRFLVLLQAKNLGAEPTQLAGLGGGAFAMRKNWRLWPWGWGLRGFKSNVYQQFSSSQEGIVGFMLKYD